MTSLHSAAQDEGLQASAVSPPEPGQLAEVQASTSGTGHSTRQHYLTLSSIGEDNLGERLGTTWT